MDPSVQLSNADRQSQSLFPSEDDDTVATPPKGEKSRKREFAVEEKTLKFKFPPPKDSNIYTFNMAGTCSTFEDEMMMIYEQHT